MTTIYRTEAGPVEGARAFNYYDMQAGTIGAPDRDGWFTFTHDDGTRATLNAERICTISHAAGMGWYADEPAADVDEHRDDAAGLIEPAIRYPDAVTAWFGPLTGNLANMSHAEKVRRVLQAAAELCPDSLAAALAEISDEFDDLTRTDLALAETVDYLNTNADDYSAQAVDAAGRALDASSTYRSAPSSDTRGDATAALNKADRQMDIAQAKASAYHDAARVIDIARGL